LGVVGPNGAGKTTLLSLLAGELAPTSGRVLLDGRDVAGMSALELAQTRAVLPQASLLRFAFQALDVVLMGRYPHPTGDEQDRVVAAASMESTDTSQLAQRIYPTLSGGEQTRVSLARVLAQETPVLFLDEPTGSLDLRHQETVMAINTALAAAGGTVVAVLHDLNVAARHADRIAVMSRGEIVEVGPARQILRRELVEDVYGLSVEVIDRPGSDRPLIVPGA